MLFGGKMKSKINEAGLEGRLVKKCIRAIFYHEFSAKTHLIFMQTKDAPSMALLVGQGKKWQEFANDPNGRALKTAVQIKKIQKSVLTRKKFVVL